MIYCLLKSRTSLEPGKKLSFPAAAAAAEGLTRKLCALCFNFSLEFARLTSGSLSMHRQKLDEAHVTLN